MKNIIYKILVMVFVVGLTQVQAGRKATIDNSDYAYILDKYAEKSGFNYAKLKKNKEDTAKLLNAAKGFNKYTPEYIKQFSKDDQFAIYVNAYNVWMLVKALELYPIKSIISEHPDFYKKTKIVVGEAMTFDILEHEILRGKYFDARVHFAVNCASKGCPPLLDEPYVGEKIEEQLELATKNFINSKHGVNILKKKTGEAEVSQLFDWFAKDFKKQEGSVLKFINKYSDKSVESVTGYINYDWDINQS